MLPVILKMSHMITAILENGSAIAPPAIVDELAFIYNVFVVGATNPINDGARLVVKLTLDFETVLFLA